MDDVRASRICLRWGQMKGDRAPFETVWQETADFIRPLRAEFNAKRSPGEKRYGKIFDSTALIASDNFAGGIYGMMSNPTNRWFELRLPDEELNLYEPVRDWLYAVENALYHSLGPQISRFYAVLPSLYADLAVFGTSIFYSEDVPHRAMINDNTRALSECVIAENAWGEVDVLYRRFHLEARQALQMFPDTLSDRSKKIAQDKPMEKVWFIHCVEPNDEYDHEGWGEANKPFLSVYVEEEARHEVAAKGYYEFPFQVPRWSQAAGEVYGRGLGEAALADVKTLNQMSRTSLVAAQKAADPPLLAPDEGVIKAARTYPSGITYGGVNAQGQKLLVPLMTGADTRLTLEMMEQRRTAIREAFYFSLMQMVGTPDMTATEWIGRQEEKLRLMGPNLGRVQSEFLSPFIKRRFGMLARANVLPPAPPELRGQMLNVEYVSPLARAQLAGEAQAAVRLYQSILPLAQIDPTVMDNVDNDAGVATLARGYAVPAKMLRGPEKVAELRQQRAVQNQMQQSMAMAAQAAQIGKDAGAGVKSAAQGRVAGAEADKASGTKSPDLGALIQQLRGAIRQSRPSA